MKLIDADAKKPYLLDGRYAVNTLVRCKDCKWRNWETNGCDRSPCVEPWFENDFCSYGERKDDEID